MPDIDIKEVIQCNLFAVCYIMEPAEVSEERFYLCNKHMHCNYEGVTILAPSELLTHQCQETVKQESDNGI
tara:strand:+ start:68 stop:280 length:213 start_codon:yes stop_codon:yes gene_type:complete